MALSPDAAVPGPAPAAAPAPSDAIPIDQINGYFDAPMSADQVNAYFEPGHGAPKPSVVPKAKPALGTPKTDLGGESTSGPGRQLPPDVYDPLHSPPSEAPAESPVARAARLHVESDILHDVSIGTGAIARGALHPDIGSTGFMEGKVGVLPSAPTKGGFDITKAAQSKQAEIDKAREELAKSNPIQAGIGNIAAGAGEAIGGAMVMPELDVGEAPVFLKDAASPVLRYLGRTVPRYFARGVAASPKALPISVQTGAQTADNVYRETGDAGKAIEAGVTNGLLTEAIGSSAIGFEGRWFTRLAAGGTSVAAMSEAQRRIVNTLLPKDQQTPFSIEGLLANGVMGGAMAWAFGSYANDPAAVESIYRENAKRAQAGDPKAQRISDVADRLNQTTGTRSLAGILGANAGVKRWDDVMASPHETLMENPDYARTFNASDGLGYSMDDRVNMAKSAFADSEMMNTAFKAYQKLKGVSDTQAKDAKAASALPALVQRIKLELDPKAAADVLDYVRFSAYDNPSQAQSILNDALTNKALLPDAQKQLDAVRQERQQFSQTFSTLKPDVQVKLQTWIAGARPPRADIQTATHQAAATGELPGVVEQYWKDHGAAQAAVDNQDKLSAQAQLEAAQQNHLVVESQLPRTDRERFEGLTRLVGDLPAADQLALSQWAITHSMIEIESVYRNAANTGELPPEVTAYGHEDAGRAEPAEVPAEQDQAGRREGQQTEVGQVAAEGVAVAGQEQAGSQGPAGDQGAQGAQGAENPSPVERPAEAAEAVTRADKAKAALAANGVSDAATVTADGTVKIAPTATPEQGDAVVDAAVQDAATNTTERGEPTDGQKVAGNYSKPPVVFPSEDGDITVKVENNDGSTRRGDWGSRKIEGVQYGYVPRTLGADGDGLDALILPGASDPKRPVAFIRQRDVKTGQFDELKMVLGARNRQEALQAYWRQYPRSLHLKLTPDGAGDVTMLPRKKAVSFIRSGANDVPPHPVSGQPMLRQRQFVPVNIDARAADWNDVQSTLDKLGGKHDLSRLTPDRASMAITGEVPRSSLPELTRVLGHDGAEVQQLDIRGNARQRNARSGAGAEVPARAPGLRGTDHVQGPATHAGPARRRVPPPQGVKEVASDAPVFQEGQGQHPVSVVGDHYSPVPDLKELDPAEAGTGSAGGERRRYGLGNFGRSGDPMARVLHFYVRSGKALPPKEQAVSGSHVYEAVLNNLYDAGRDPDGIIARANANGMGSNKDYILEQIHDAGYDGFVSPDKLPGMHARVASLIGIKGTVPVREVTDELAPTISARRAGKFEGQSPRTRDKVKETAHALKEGASDEEKERIRSAAKVAQEAIEKFRARRPMLRLRHDDKDRKPSEEAPAIHLELTASPKRPGTYYPFKGLSPPMQKVVNDFMQVKIGPATARLQRMFPGMEVHEQIGGYGDDISQSLRIDVPKGATLEQTQKLASDLATAYTQDSVMLLDKRIGTDDTAVDIHFGKPEDAKNPAKVEAVWKALRDEMGDDVTGFTQTDDGMVIVNPGLKFEDSGPWAERIRQVLDKLPDEYNAEARRTSVDFVGNRYDSQKLDAEFGTLSAREVSILDLANQARETLGEGIRGARGRAAANATAEGTDTAAGILAEHRPGLRGNDTEPAGGAAAVRAGDGGRAAQGSGEVGDAGSELQGVAGKDTGGTPEGNRPPAFGQRTGREGVPSELEQVASRHRAELDAERFTHRLPAPNGKTSKLTTHQWLLVRTPAFKRWAGDWETDPANSKVDLDPVTKEPAVYYSEVYAGAVKPVLTQGFRTDLPYARIGDSRVPAGIFLKGNPETIGVGGKFGRQLGFFLKMRNPLHVAEKSDIFTKLEAPDMLKEDGALRDEGAYKALENAGNAAMVRGVPFRAAQIMYEHARNRLADEREVRVNTLQSNIANALKAKGYDGLVIEADHGDNGMTVKSTIALDSKQLKSVDNVGTFGEDAAPLYRSRHGASRLTEAERTSPEHVEEVKAAATQLLGTFKLAPRLNVHPTLKDAPPEVRDAISNTLGEDAEGPPAMYLDGEMHVFADRNYDAADTQASVLHEMVHYGLRRVFGDQMNPLLDDIWKGQHGKMSRTFRDVLDDYRHAYRGRPDLRRNITEEYIARIAENGRDRSVWQKVVGWVRARFRDMGIVSHWTDNDIRGLVAGLYRDLRDGRTSVSGIDPTRSTVDFAEGLTRTPYMGGEFVEDRFGDQRFTSPDVEAVLDRPDVGGMRILGADPVRLTAQGVHQLAALAGEEHARLSLPASYEATVKKSGATYQQVGQRIVLDAVPHSAELYSLRKQEPMDDDVRAIVDRNIRFKPSPQSPWNWMQSKIRNLHFGLLANDLKRATLDMGAYLDMQERKLNGGMLHDAASSAYTEFHMARNYRQIAAAVLRIGAPEYRGGSFVAAGGREGLMDIWKPIFQTADGQSHYEQFGAYATAVRAKQLLHETNKDGTPREKRWTEPEADLVIQRMEQQHPEFKSVLAKQMTFLKQVYDLAVDRGVMTREQADAFTRNAYVPFYRVLEPEEGLSEGPKAPDSQFSRHDTIKTHRIKGADLAISDPLESFVNNVVHVVDHIYTNEARRRIMALGSQMGAVRRMPVGWQPAKVSVADTLGALRKAGIEVDRSLLSPDDLAQMVTVFHPVAPFAKDIQSTAENGKLVWWRVDDPRLLHTLQSIHDYNPLLHTLPVRIGSTVARWARYGITISPKFMLRIMLKDMMQSFAQTNTGIHGAELGVNMLRGAIQNAGKIWNNDRFIDQLRLNGFNGNEYYKIDAIRDYMEGMHNKTGVLNTGAKMLHAYRRAGWVSEQLSRVRIAKQVVDDGGTWAEAAWQGQNTLNWQVHGASHLMQAFIRIVPFLNAHMRGISRLYDGAVGRDVTINRGRAIAGFAARSMVLGGLTLLLTSLNANNKDYERLPLAIKDGYWNFYIAGRHYMLPKPFEWGMIAASLPEHLYLEATRHEDVSQVAAAVRDMAFNEALPVPVPTIATPVEAAADFDIRNWRPILTTSQSESQLPQTRVNPSTTEFSRVVGEKTHISPVKIDYVVRGMLGGVGITALQLASSLMRVTGDFPARVPTGGGSITDEALSSLTPFGGQRAVSETGDQYLNDFYDAQAESDDLVGSVHAYVTRGEYGKAQQLAEGNPLAFSGQHTLNQLAAQMKKLRQSQRAVEASHLTADQKRTALANINLAQRRTLDAYEPFFRAVIEGKKQIEREP